MEFLMDGVSYVVIAATFCSFVLVPTLFLYLEATTKGYRDRVFMLLLSAWLCYVLLLAWSYERIVT